MSEPTMDEILANIKRIIREESPAAQSLPSARLSDVRAKGVSKYSLLILLIGFLLGWFAYSLVDKWVDASNAVAQQLLAQAEASAKQPVSDPVEVAGPHLYEMSPLIVSLPPIEGSRRSLLFRVALSIEVDKSADVEKLRGMDAVLQDSARAIIVSIGAQKLYTPEGAVELKERLHTDLQAKVPQITIKAILLREMIGQ